MSEEADHDDISATVKAPGIPHDVQIVNTPEQQYEPENPSVIIDPADTYVEGVDAE